jgi:serine protease Do
LGDAEYDASVVGAAPDKDVAVLKVEASAGQLTPLVVGRSRDLVVGQRVLAVGNPFGFDHTLTTGVVSGLGRELSSPSGRRIRDVIQTDAAINPGNSGGPLLDSSGRLIGINSAIYSPSGASAGISFAVPVDTVSRLVPQLIRYGRIKQPGIAGASLVSDSIARANGIEGIPIYQVDEGSPSDEAGLTGITVSRRGRPRLGDVIVAVDGKTVDGPRELAKIIGNTAPGKDVEITLWRNNKSETVKLTLGELPATDKQASADDQSAPDKGSALKDFGLTVTASEDGKGIVVTDVDPSSAAAERGIQAGDVIMSVNSKEVSAAGDFEKAIAEASKAGRKAVLVQVAREDGSRFVALPVAKG